jgi:hypothetical protein
LGWAIVVGILKLATAAFNYDIYLSVGNMVFAFITRLSDWGDFRIGASLAGCEIGSRGGYAEISNPR